MNPTTTKGKYLLYFFVGRGGGGQKSPYKKETTNNERDSSYLPSRCSGKESDLPVIDTAKALLSVSTHSITKYRLIQYQLIKYPHTVQIF